MNILMVSSEVVPFAKTGGLADVAGSLPLALENLGMRVKIFMPKYKQIKIKQNKTIIGKGTEIFFIKNDKFFNRENLYGDKKGDYPDNLDRFAYFSKKCLKLAKRIGFKPDIIHCNDWQSSLIPVYLKSRYSQDEFYSTTKTLLTIHNLSYQGLFKKSEFPKTDLDLSLFSIDALEYYDKVCLLKGGILFSDYINTVSPAYSKEIQTKEFGCGLEGVLKNRSNALCGILNGIDTAVWNPATNKAIAENYDFDFVEGKGLNKLALQKECGLKQGKDIPLIGMVSRLADQKGLDLISKAIKNVLKMGAQFILLGTGDALYHKLFEKIAKTRKAKASVNLRFDAVLAEKIYASSELFLMPSRFEPCGLGQLICFRYGTIPIARLTGGLKDTVHEYNETTKAGDGFTFTKYSSSELLKAVKKALRVYKDKAAWRDLTKKVMQYDYSWEASAKEYVKLYGQICPEAENNEARVTK